MSNKLTVLVTGATGTQGGALVRELLEKGHAVRALTRKPDGDPARTLASKGVQVVPGSFEDASSLAGALEGADAVFAMGTPFEAGPAAEVAQGKALIDAARRVRTKHFVYSSVGSAHLQTGIPHFESKRRVEEHLVASDLPYTILRPVYFMESLMAPWTLPALAQGTFALGLPSGRKLQQVAIRDLARLTALAIERRTPFLGKDIDVASDELSPAELVAALGAATGRSFTHLQIPLSEVKKSSEDFALMLEWFDKVGYTADIQGLRRAYPEVGWQSFPEWLRSQDLSRLAV
jgi:uncharacterized protein YbjT (DUF2867 family)